MKNWIKNQTICLLLISTLIASVTHSCKITQQTTDTKDLSYLYNPTKSPFNPLYNVINKSDKSSVLSVKFFPNDLFFSEANPQGIPTAQMIINVKLFNISQGRVLADTAIYNINIVKEEGRAEYIYNIPLRVEKDLEYITEIKIIDRLRLHVIQT